MKQYNIVYLVTINNSNTMKIKHYIKLVYVINKELEHIIYRLYYVISLYVGYITVFHVHRIFDIMKTCIG